MKKIWDMRKPSDRKRIKKCGFRWGEFFSIHEHVWRDTRYELAILYDRMRHAKTPTEHCWRYGYKEGWKSAISTMLKGARRTD